MNYTQIIFNHDALFQSSFSLYTELIDASNQEPGEFEYNIVDWHLCGQGTHQEVRERRLEPTGYGKVIPLGGSIDGS